MPCNYPEHETPEADSKPAGKEGKSPRQHKFKIENVPFRRRTGRREKPFQFELDSFLRIRNARLHLQFKAVRSHSCSAVGSGYSLPPPHTHTAFSLDEWTVFHSKLHFLNTILGVFLPACVCVCTTVLAWCLEEARRRYGFPWTWSYILFWATT